MDTIREIIIQNFITRAALITAANGYNSDIGTTVLRVRKTIDPDELPAVIVWPQPEKATHAYGELSCIMSLRVEGIALFGTSNPSVIAEQILGDLKKCFLAPANLISSPPYGWSRSPDYIDSIVYTGGGTEDYPDDDKKTIGASATFDVSYTTKLENPNAQ